MATTATHNSSRASDESSELLEQHLHDTAELESNTTGDYPPDERQGGIALADAGESSTTESKAGSGLGEACLPTMKLTGRRQARWPVG